MAFETLNVYTFNSWNCTKGLQGNTCLDIYESLYAKELSQSKAEKEHWYSNFEINGVCFLFYSSWRNFIGINISKYKISINIKQNAYQKQQLSIDFFLAHKQQKVINSQPSLLKEKIVISHAHI